MIWIFGLIDLDILTYSVAEFPPLDGVLRVQSINLKSGGPALNAAMTIAKLGGQPVNLIGHIGDDDAGQILVRELEKTGVGTSRLHTEANTDTGMCHVYVHPDGERSFIYANGSNACLSPDSIQLDWLNRGDHLHISGVFIIEAMSGDALRTLLQQVKQRGVFVSVDMVGFHAWETAVSALPYIDLFMANQPEFSHITETDDPAQAAQRLVNAGVKIAALKLGGAGSYILSKEWSGHVPAFPINLIDTTGAGDAFAGSFVYGLARGWPIRQAATFANAVGALCATTIGATDGIRSYAATKQFIEASGK